MPAARTQPAGADYEGDGVKSRKPPLRKRRPRLFYGIVVGCCLLLSVGVAALVVYLVLFQPVPGLDVLPNSTAALLTLTGCAAGSSEPLCEQFEFANTLTYAVAMGSPELLERDIRPALSSECVTGMWNKQCSGCWDDLQWFNFNARLAAGEVTKVYNLTRLDNYTVRVEYTLISEGFLLSGTAFQQMTIGWGATTGLVEYISLCSDTVLDQFGEAAEAQRIADIPPLGTGGTYREDGVLLTCPSFRCVHEDGWGVGERFPFTTTPEFNDVFLKDLISQNSAEAAAGPQANGEKAGSTLCHAGKVTCWCVDPTWCCSNCDSVRGLIEL